MGRIVPEVQSGTGCSHFLLRSSTLQDLVYVYRRSQVPERTADEVPVRHPVHYRYVHLHQVAPVRRVRQLRLCLRAHIRVVVSELGTGVTWAVVRDPLDRPSESVVVVHRGEVPRLQLVVVLQKNVVSGSL